MTRDKIDVIVHDGFAPILKTIENTLEGFHEELHCETMQGLTNTTLGHRFGIDVFLDDNGKLYGQDTITGLFVRDGHVVDYMVGPVLMCRHDNDGDSVSAEADDMLDLIEFMRPGDCLKVPDGFRFKVAETLLVLPC